ncbi:MAG: TonB-dependent receptor, partial [Bacteroidia bacterium]|nr:TonB-dependent receptor [Bacteroidia bacterium]
MKKIAFACLFFISAFAGFSQNGTVSGKVMDIKGDPMPFVVIIVDSTKKIVQTDFDGLYTISLPKGKHSLKFSMTSYSSKLIEDVFIKAGEVTDLSVVLEESKGSNVLEEIIITAKAKDESVAAEALQQKNNAAVSDGIGGERIKNSPVTNTSDVLRKVNGASIQDNKFVIVRGLNDRYNAAFLNGAALPSSESDRKAFAFDIFPSNMLDNLSINKTATPDMPGEFAGGLILIKTKNIPDKNFQSFSIGGGYNTVTTFKDQVTYKGGKLDWLGMDDGTRSLPSEIPDKENFPVSISQQANLAKYMKNDWALGSSKFSPNVQMQYSFGYTFKRKQKDSLAEKENKRKGVLGMIVSLSYNRSNNLVETVRKSYTSSFDPGVPSIVDNEYLDKAFTTQILSGAIANFAYKINEANTIGFKNIYSINSDNRVIYREGTTNPLDVNPSLLRSNARWFTGNNIYSGQLTGEHFLKKSKIKMEWIASYSNIKREIPNLRRSVYSRYKTFNDPSDPIATDTMYAANIALSTVSPAYGGGIFNSKTTESTYIARYDVSRAFDSKNKDHSIDFKIGGYVQNRNRYFAARQLGFTKYSVVGGGVTFNNNLLYLPEDQIFSNENMGILPDGSGGFKLLDVTRLTDDYHAVSDLYAGYFMFDYRFKESIRIIAGVRNEFFHQVLDAEFDDGEPLNLSTEKNDILPSFNGVFSLTKKQNIRVSYSQTLNRPEFRELAPFAFYDFNTNFLYSGNDKLKRAKIHNYDLRYEVYPGRGQIFSVTAFHKYFINPIEQISRADVVNEVSFANAA